MPPYVWTAERRRYWELTLKFHGLTGEQLSAWRKALLIRQRYLCAVCKRSLAGKKANLDHDHATGEVRGMLCWRCNKAAGTHRAEILRRLADYVECPPARQLPPLSLESVVRA